MEAGRLSETLLPIYQAERCCCSKCSHLQLGSWRYWADGHSW